MTVPPRAALYPRVSTARQAEHDVSIPDQKRQGEAYCQSRGYELVGPHHGIERQFAQNPRHRLGRKIGYARRSRFCSEMADGVGFEPTVRLRARRFSRPLPSTARPPIPFDLKLRNRSGHLKC